MSIKPPPLRRPPTRRKRTLTEGVIQPRITADRVDREARVIRGVKVLGLESPNGKHGRQYTRDCLEKAFRARLYEGVKVRTNHPRKPTDTRPVDDTLGWLENVTLREDGLYADLHYLESNPTHTLLLEAAERKPDLLGLSHNAQGDVGRNEAGVEVVKEILEVRSVDLVDDPATTDGLFEEKRPVILKLKTLLEAIKLPQGKEKAGRKTIANLLEMGALDGDMPMEDTEAPAEDAPPADHAEALRSGFEASCNAVIAQALSGDMDPKEALKKLKDLINGHAGLAEAPVEEAEETPEEGEEMEEECEEEDEKKGKARMESRERRLKARETAYDLLEEAGLPVDKDLVLALVGMPDKAAMQRFIEREKGKSGKPAPRSGSGGGRKTVTESKNGQAEDELAEFMMAARN